MSRVSNLLLRELVLGVPDHGDLGDGVDAVRKALQVETRGKASGSLTTHALALGRLCASDESHSEEGDAWDGWVSEKCTSC